MSALTDTARVAAPGNPLSQSVRDSLVVAKRNLIRLHVSVGKEQAK
ncbi:hypothetical protein ACFYZ8_13225 [Streptomyces sp. NPDC001668]